MLTNFKEDLKILGKFFLANLGDVFNKVKFLFIRKQNKRQLKEKTLMEIILEYEGAKKLGGEFLGQRTISKTPVLFYRLKRRSTDGTGAYFYVGYINREKKENPSNLYQVVLEEDWDAFIPSIKRAIDTNQKTIIGIRIREGGRQMEVLKAKQEGKSFKEMDERNVIILAKEGDSEAFEWLYKKYSNIIRFKSRKYFAPGLVVEDLEQEGSIGLYNAIRDYDIDHPTPFRVFCELCVERQIITAVKTATRQKHQPLNQYSSFEKPVYDDESERTMHDTIENKKQFTPEEIVIDRESIYQLLTKLKDRLSPFESEVFEGQLQRLSYFEIAESLNSHIKSVDNAMQRIRKKVIKVQQEIEELEGK